MTKLKEEYNCALLLAMDLVGGKWKLRILWHILNGDNRFSLLQKGIPDISEKMLATQLRELDADELILRKVINEKPLNVQYSLNDKYIGIKAIVESLCDFSKEYASKNDIVVKD